MKLTVEIDKVIAVVERQLLEVGVRVMPGSGKVVYSGFGGDSEVEAVEFELDQAL